MTVSQRDLDRKSNTEDKQDNRKRTLLFKVTNCVDIPPVAEVSVSLLTSRVRLIYMALNLNSLQNQMVLLPSGMVKVQSQVPVTVGIVTILKNPITLPKRNVIQSGERHTRSHCAPGPSLKAPKERKLKITMYKYSVSLWQTQLQPSVTNRKSYEMHPE